MIASEAAETKACPWCGETILAVAKKCKHCGEFLVVGERDSADIEDGLESTSSDEIEGRDTSASTLARWQWDENGGYWKCRAHSRGSCRACLPKPPLSAKPTGETRDAYLARINSTRLGGSSTVSSRAVPIKNGVPTCSKCGGTQFTARRKTSTKVMFGLASLAGKPKFVECEVCGARCKRTNA